MPQTTARGSAPAEPAPAHPPRLAASPASDPGDLDPQFPDLDGVALDGAELRYPEARTLTVLRSRVVACSLAIGEATVDAQDAVFTDVDLSGRRFDGLQRVVFERCRMTGADFGDARLRDVEFRDCALSLASLRSATVERAVISGGSFDEVDASGARMTDVTVEGVRLSELGLGNTRLERVDVTGADLTGLADLRELGGAIISPTQAIALAVRLARVAGIHVAEPPDPAAD